MFFIDFIPDLWYINLLENIVKEFNFMKAKNTEFKIAVLFILLFLASLVPLMLLSKYNYPCADDFGFSAYSHIAWENSHSIIQVLKGAWNTTIERWWGWQGTFSSIFVMALQPAIWGEAGYSLVPWIMIGAMSISTLFFFNIVLRKILEVRTPIYISISMIYLFFAVQCMIDKTQGFFWYNGATHYMLPHCAALFLIGLLLQILINPVPKKYTFFLACVIAFLVGGSNYITGLTVLILFLTALLLLLYHKNKRNFYVLTVPFLFFILAFLLNTLAPGNSVRQEEMMIRPGIIKSILLSFYYSTEYITNTWFDWTYLIFLLFLIPFIWEIVKTAGKRFSFRAPLLVLIYSYCLISSMFTPSLFATGEAGGGRIFNIIFLDFLLLVIGNMFYFLGWLYNHIPQLQTLSESCLEQREIKFYFLGLFCLTAFIAILYIKVNPNYFTTPSAVSSLISGEAAAYGKEASERTELLHASLKDDLSIKLFTVHPYLLYYSDIAEDPGDWKNKSMARYYQKKSIIGINSQ